jgi:hypothetical protein
MPKARMTAQPARMYKNWRSSIWVAGVQSL